MNIYFPKRPEKNNIEKISIQVAHHQFFAEKIPLESTISYPIPILEENRCLLGYFHYSENRFYSNAVANKHLQRPSSTIIVSVSDDMKSFDIISYEIATSEKLVFVTLPDPIVVSDKSPINKDKIKKMEDVLYLSCEVLLKSQGRVSPKIMKAYRDALLKLEWPGLIPYYRSLSPEFSTAVNL